ADELRPDRHRGGAARLAARRGPRGGLPLQAPSLRGPRRPSHGRRAPGVEHDMSGACSNASADADASSGENSAVPRTSSPPWQALAAALVTVCFWASAFVGIRSAGRHFDAAPLALGRLLVG